MRDVGTWLTGHSPVVAAGGIVVGSVLLGLLLRRLLFASLARLAMKTPWAFDDILVASLRRALPLWFAFGGLFSALHILSLPDGLRNVVEKALVALLIASLTLWAAGLGGRLFELASAPDGAPAARSAGVIRYVVKVAVIVVGALVLLSTLGISVTPVLTTVGIGGLAVALGLQETVANLFAGIQVTLAGNIRIGDFVRLESGEEGYVEDIAWRAARIRTLPNNSVLIPNNRLAQSVVTNYHRPSRDLAVLVEVGVHYGSDLGEVERVTCQVGKRIMQSVPGAVPDFEPFIRFHTFGPSSVDFTTILRAREFGDRFVVKHEFIKALMIAYKAARIVIPYPIRALNLEQENAHVELRTPRGPTDAR